MTENIFKKTAKQTEAIFLLASTAIYIMLYGGSRSGKTFIILYAIIVRACKVKSRHLIVRLKFNHVKTSIWMDTLPKMLRICFPDLKWHPNKTDYFIELPNGSEVWIAGLDDKERTEKVLGKEYSSIFFNENSQIPYASVVTALTRLAEKNSLVKKAYYDENPPSKAHWSYNLFIRGKDPDSHELIDRNDYACLLMNPKDNKENIDEVYLTKILGNLPKKARERFMEGLFADATEGAIYYGFNETLNVKEFDKSTFNGMWKAGQDFNVNPMCGVQGWITHDDYIYIWDEMHLENSNTYKAGDWLFEKYGSVDILPDSTGKARKSSSVRSDDQILTAKKHNVIQTRNPMKKDRYNCVNGLLEHGKIIIHPRCKNLIDELESLTDDNINDKDVMDHTTDALGYLCWKYYPIKKLRKSFSKQL